MGRRFSGGIAADVYPVSAGRRRLVLKLPHPDADEPAAARREAKCLAIARLGGLSVAEVVASREDALLLTRLPGRPRLRPGGDFRPFVSRLLDLLPAIHAVGVAGEDLPRYRPYSAERVRLYAGEEPPSGPDVFLHRDFHQGNVLLAGERVGGVVDWLHACVGPAWADVAHLRANLYNFVGAEAADFAVEEFQRRNPHLPPYHPYWDVATLASMSWPRARTLLAAAISKL